MHSSLVDLHDRFGLCQRCRLPTSVAFRWLPWQTWWLPDYKAGKSHSMMIQDQVWASAGMHPDRLMEVDWHKEFGEFLHQRCLEKRLGRKLTVDDLDCKCMLSEKGCVGEGD